jgi:hypothetical protein
MDKLLQWKKLGRIFDPAVLEPYRLSAALMPMVKILNEETELVRVYYAPRDLKGRSEIRFFEFKLSDPFKILKLSNDAVYKHGKLGTFDDSGITPGNILKAEGKTLLYYTGWNLTVTVPMNNSIGVAEMGEDGNFFRYGDGPIMTRVLEEPYSCASPFVMFEDGKYRMWYASKDKWEIVDQEPKHYYNIKYAESKDGINWNREGHAAIDYEGENDYAFGRPFVLKEDGIYKMWYAFRGDYYIIGYAESDDGINWVRKDDKAGIDVSPEGWDSEMIEYPCIFDCKGERYMLYNGNGYGKTGIGLAIQKTV